MVSIYRGFFPIAEHWLATWKKLWIAIVNTHLPRLCIDGLGGNMEIHTVDPHSGNTGSGVIFCIWQWWKLYKPFHVLILLSHIYIIYIYITWCKGYRGSLKTYSSIHVFFASNWATSQPHWPQQKSEVPFTAKFSTRHRWEKTTIQVILSHFMYFHRNFINPASF